MKASSFSAADLQRGCFSGSWSPTPIGPGIEDAAGGEVMVEGVAGSADAPRAVPGDSGFAEAGPVGTGTVRSGPLLQASNESLRSRTVCLSWARPGAPF